jgi:predicted TIM-barrel enzyme
MACAFDITPSVLCPVDAPVKMPTLKGLPAACSASAFFANSLVTALAVPAGVNPLRPMFSSFWISAAASAAVIRVYAIISLSYNLCAKVVEIIDNTKRKRKKLE